MEIEYDCVKSLLSESNEIRPLVDKPDYKQTTSECDNFGAWYVFKSIKDDKAKKTLIKKTTNGKFRESSTAKGARNSRFEERIQNQQRITNRLHSGEVNSENEITLTNFRHLPEPAFYMKEYRTMKRLSLSAPSIYSDEYRLKSSQYLPTTHIILNSASALRKPTNNSNTFIRKENTRISKRYEAASDGLSTQEQHVLCSPPKVIPYDCGISHKTDMPRSTSSQTRCKTSREKLPRNLLQTNIKLTPNNLCVHGVGETMKPQFTTTDQMFPQRKRGQYPIEWSAANSVLPKTNNQRQFFLTGT